ncbi:MAG: DegV family protein [Clostridia bacterium]|nr:DegV family protein [Clostridia bacterium]
MTDYKITCCTTADISAEHLKELDIAYCKNRYIIDGVEYYDDFYQSETPEEFYGKIQAGALPVTSPVTEEDIIALFEPILSAGYDLLHIEFSSGLSQGWKSAQAARVAMKTKYPDRKIYVVDSLAASSGYGMLVDMAADYRRRGMGIDELRSWLEENKLRIRHWFCSGNLMHLKRGGRISTATAVVGWIFQAYPIMDVNDRGMLILREKAFGKKRTLKHLISHMKEEALDGLRYNEACYICHSMMQEDAEILKKMVESEFPKLKDKVQIFPIGSVIGSHSGPGTIALFYLSKDNRER